MRIKRFALGFGVWALLIVLSFVSFADAQTTKKKKTHKTSSAKTSQTSVGTQPTTDPTVVSRASDYQDSSSIIIPPTETTGAASIETERDRQLADLSARIRQLESSMKDGYDEKQKRLLLNLDILTKAEQRTESLRKQRFDLLEKENSIQSRLDQIEIDIRPENIERQVAVMGTLRPEEIRDAKRKSLDSERKNLQALLAQVQTTRSSLDQTVDKAEQLVQKLRVTMEADIDKALSDDKNNP
jgi:uncharacterized protein YdeI (BOF family)